MSDLPSSLRGWYEAKARSLAEQGVKVGLFESPEGREKSSFGVSLELSSRVSYLTAWNSGELQISSIDLDVDLEPKEAYRENVSEDDLLVIADGLTAWIFRI